MVEICRVCEGLGLRMVEENGRQVARACECRVERRIARMLKLARIPPNFKDSSLDSYEILEPKNESLKRALTTAKSFARGYPVETEGRGLLFSGSKGLGKTFLAVSILKSLVVDRGASGVFWEHKELMENLRGAMFGSTVGGTEDTLLRSLTRCDVLVLDDLGDLTPSDWTWDTTSYILNSRYNENLSTIITTNLENRASLSSTSEPYDRFAEVRRTMTQLTLGDRIGDRMWSRLQEMCVVVEMHGKDNRLRMKRASFAAVDTSIAPALQAAEEAVRAAYETLRSAKEAQVPRFSQASKVRAQVNSNVVRAPIDRSVDSMSDQARKDPIVDSNQSETLAARKRDAAEFELGIRTKENDPNFGKVYQYGECVDMITGGEQVDEIDVAALEREQEKPAVGRDRMGKNKIEPRDVKYW